MLTNQHLGLGIDISTYNFPNLNSSDGFLKEKNNFLLYIQLFDT